MQDVLTEVLEKRKNRCIAIVLGVKEHEIDRELNAQQSQKLRKVILDQFNDFYFLVVDVMSTLDTGDVVLNGHYLDKLNDIHNAIVGNGNGN